MDYTLELFDGIKTIRACQYVLEQWIEKIIISLYFKADFR